MAGIALAKSVLAAGDGMTIAPPPEGSGKTAGGAGGEGGVAVASLLSTGPTIRSRKNPPTIPSHAETDEKPCAGVASGYHSRMNAAR